MKVLITHINLRGFDSPVPPTDQELPEGIAQVDYRCITDAEFPPIADLPGRFQYRIPKLFAWQMFPGYDYYLHLDGEWTLRRADSLKWYLEQLGNGDIGFYAHPNRSSIKQEVEYIDDYLHRRKGYKKGQDYIINRYNNGLHKEQLADIELDTDFTDDKLYASTIMFYRDSEELRDMMRLWWLHQSRYYTCDQVVLPYVLWKSDLVVKTFDQAIYKTGHMSKTGSHHE